MNGNGTRSLSLTRSQYRLLGLGIFVLLCLLFLLPSNSRSRLSRIYEHVGQQISDPSRFNLGGSSFGGEGSGVALAPDPQSDQTASNKPADVKQSAAHSGIGLSSQPIASSAECDARFGKGYIEGFTRTSAQHCDAESTANLTCFSHRVSNDRLDSFCFGGPALFDFAHKGKISLDCRLRDWTEIEKSAGVPRIEDLPDYWYNTGPKYILDQNIDLFRMDDPPPERSEISLLIEREDNNDNLWHTLMEIMSLTFSLDVLSKAIDPHTNKPYYSEKDIARSQAVFTDRLPHGPYWDLWRLVAEKPSIRMTEIANTLHIALTKVLLPLPGGSNPFWQADWSDVNCGESPLLKRFVQRVLDFYDIVPPAQTKPLTLTFIDRHTKRMLLEQDAYLAELKNTYPHVLIQVVDFADKPLAKQIRIAHETDILVGVHGAGLAHGMFMRPGSTIVEILPPGLQHKGFANMARFLGHHHLSAHGSPHESKENTGEWQHDDVMIGFEKFLFLIEKAVANAQQQLHSAASGLIDNPDR